MVGFARISNLCTVSINRPARIDHTNPLVLLDACMDLGASTSPAAPLLRLELPANHQINTESI